MAHFYGVLSNDQNQDRTMRGHKTTGIEATAASYEGAIRVSLYWSESEGRDMVAVRMVPWEGAGTERTLYRGPVGEFAPSTVHWDPAAGKWVYEREPGV